jgi:hypothetical protein
MDILNAKVQTTQDETRFEAQNVGLYGYDSTDSKWRRLTCDAEGKLNIEATLELDSSTLNKEATQLLVKANQTNGTQQAMCMGNDSGVSQKQILVSNTGVVQTLDSEVFGKTSQIANQTTLSNTNEATIIANQTNGTQIATVGNTVGDGSGTATHLKTSTDGSVHVVVENSDNVLIKGIQDGTTTQKDAKTNSNGDLRSALIGNTVKDGTGDNYYVLVDSDGKLQTSGGGGGGSASNQYNNGGTEETLSVIAPTAPATGQVTPAVTIFDMTNYKGIAINVTTTSGSYFDLNVGIEFSNSATFLTTLGAAYSDIQTFNTATDVGGNPVAGQYVANVLMTPEFNSQQPQARYARATFNHNNNFGSNISVTINAIQMPF